MAQYFTMASGSKQRAKITELSKLKSVLSGSSRARPATEARVLDLTEESDAEAVEDNERRDVEFVSEATKAAIDRASE